MTRPPTPNESLALLALGALLGRALCVPLERIDRACHLPTPQTRKGNNLVTASAIRTALTGKRREIDANGYRQIYAASRPTSS